MEYLQPVYHSILMMTVGARDGCPERSPTNKCLPVQAARLQLLNTCLLVIVTLLMICLAQPASAQHDFRVGPLYAEKSGEVSVVVELPESSEAIVSEFELIEDDTHTVPAYGMEPFRNSKKWKLALALCVDTSGTMVKRSKPNDPLTETRKALHRILEEGLLRSQDQIAVSSFATKIIHGKWFAPPGDGLKAAISALESPNEQHTVLYDALYDALDHLKHFPQSEPVRRRVLVISDGHDEESKIKNINVVRDYAIKLRIPVDVVARVRTDRASYVRKKGYTEELLGLASETGGRFKLAGPGEVYDALSEMLTGIMNSPVLHFKRTVLAAGPKTSSVGVSWQSSAKRALRSSIPARIPVTESEPVQTKIAVTKPEPVKVDMAGSEPVSLDTGLHSQWAIVLTGLVLALVGLAWFWMWNRGATSSSNGPTPVPDQPMVEPEREPEPRGRVTVVGNHFSPPGPGHPCVVLLGASGLVEGRQYPVDKEEFRIGAAHDNDLPIVDDEYVSAYHAELRVEGGSLFLFDQGSKNKTYLNGFEIGDSGAEISLGDSIKIGSSVLEVTAPD